MIESPPDDLWPVTFAVEPATPVRLVSAAGGLVIAAGTSLHMVRPGSQRLRSRDLPSDVGVIAAEPWSPYRLALATPASVGIYSGHRPYESVFDVQFAGPEFSATHLAWSREEGNSLLNICQRHGEVSRVNLGDLSTGVLECPPIAAVASDPDGVLALLNLAPVEPANVGEAWILPAGGKDFDVRWLDATLSAEESSGWKVHLAVRGSAVAYSLDPLDALENMGEACVSWEADEDDNNTFDRAPGVFMGPIAFQNARTIFAAYNCEGWVQIRRYVRNGSFTCIGRFGAHDDKAAPATVTALAWDDERRALWAASPELGLIKLTEPRKPN